MASTTETTSLAVGVRAGEGSRAARRLRRAGNVPGVIYGGTEESVAFRVDARILRNALAHSGAVIEVSLDGAKATPAVVKEVSRHPVSGAIMHLDLLRVRLDQTIQSTVAIELLGSEDAPGVRQGGVLEQIAREVTIEALPGDIPDTIRHDVSDLEVGATLTLASLTAPAGVSIVDDPETVVATISASRLRAEGESEIEQEIEVIGEASAEAKAKAAEGEAESGA